MRSSRMTSTIGLLLLQQIGHEGEIARPLDGLRQFALLLRGNRGDAARHDLAALGGVAQQQLHVLVIDLGRIRAAERAALAPAETRPAGAGAGNGRAGHSATPWASLSSVRASRRGRSSRSR